MKRKLLIYIVGIMLLTGACVPIEERDTLGAKMPASEFVYSITQNAADDYILYLDNRTPGVLFSWDYAWGSSLRQKDTVRMLVPGTYTVKITATTAGGIVFDEFPVTVTKSDPNAFQEPEWDMLTNMAAGKTWVWDTGQSAPWGNGGFKGCNAPCWWAVSYNDLVGRGVGSDEMTFDLNGGRNLTLTAASVPAAGTTKGAFNLDMSSTIPGWSVGKITTTNVCIINGINVNDGNAQFTDYYLLKLSDDELHLAAAQPGTGDWGEAWFWLFKPRN
ncbi:MAG: hypothetical protein K0B05_09560 [Bacteroidales bacterium]|nr:hypothetical protein [Bacteroidales bacterium]